MSNMKIPSLEKFKKTILNEDIDIPPALASQYFTVKKQVADKQAQVDILQKQIDQKTSEMGILNKNLIAIETKAAEMQGKQIQAQQSTAQQPSSSQAKAGQTTAAATPNESIQNDFDLSDIISENFDLDLDIDKMPFFLDESEEINILINEEEIETEEDEDAVEELSSDYVFALRINDPAEEEEIICKVYRNQDEDFWKIRVVQGSEEPLETMQFDPSMDMVSIIERIAEIYEEVEEIDMDEYEDLLDDKEEKDEEYFGDES
jgi:hypothetical protein